MTAREKTIAICVGAAVGLLALDQYLLQPMFDRLSSADALIEQHQTELNDAETLMQTRNRAKRKWNETAKKSIMTDASSAEQQMAVRVSELAERANLKLSTSKAEKGERTRGFDVWGDKRTATGNMQQIGRFLYELQHTDIPIRVTDLNITSRKDATDDLTLSLSLSTIYQGPTPQKVAMTNATGSYR
ncbi:MAG: hypothetical protein QM754_21255 [Tepidisphaeraceae bacterium]